MLEALWRQVDRLVQAHTALKTMPGDANLAKEKIEELTSAVCKVVSRFISDHFSLV